MPALLGAREGGRITFIDGERGILRYRGYPIEELAESGDFLETAYLILHGELPDRRRLYPNVDFYSGIIYQALQIPVDMFPVMFAIPRTVGWLAQWEEMLQDAEQKIARPRQLYLGAEERHYVPITRR